MSKSSTACSHRWVIAFYDGTATEEVDALMDVIAVDGCSVVQDAAHELLAANPTWVAEAMGARFKHFKKWLEKDVATECDESD